MTTESVFYEVLEIWAGGAKVRKIYPDKPLWGHSMLYWEEFSVTPRVGDIFERNQSKATFVQLEPAAFPDIVRMKRAGWI